MNSRIPSEEGGPQTALERRKSYRTIQWIFIALTLSLVLWLGKILILDREMLVQSAYNPLNEAREVQVLRGEILDRSGIPIAYTQPESEERKYPYHEALAHVTGYTGRGKSGLEAIYSDTLTKSGSLISQLESWANDEKEKGMSVQTTLDAELCAFAYEQLEGYRGAIIVSDPATGRILCLVSAPSYDPETIMDSWEEIAEEEDSPFFARATQGLYAPGSTFKTVTALAMMRHMPDYESFSYSCDGVLEMGEDHIACAGSHAHGTQNLEGAYAYSCNGFFSMAGIELGPKLLRDTAAELLIGDTFDFVLPAEVSSINLKDNEADTMIARTAFGQGETLMTPFSLHMLTSAIAAEGKLFSPLLVERVLDGNHQTQEVTNPRLYGTILSSAEAASLEKLMNAVTAYGTGKSLDNNGQRYDIYGKTGTAQVEGEEDHSWYTGYTRVQGKLGVAITVLVENGGDQKRAMPIVQAVLDYYYRQ